MLGTYCFFDLEPNKELKLGVLKFSWIICKIDEDNHMFTLSSSDYYVRQENPKFKNYDFKAHGISNKVLKLEGENFTYILDRLLESLKTMNVDYVCGFKIREHDLKYIYKIAEKYNLTDFKKDFFERKYIVLDVLEIIAEYTKKNNFNVKLTFEHLYPYIFNKAQFPKTKYHNTATECQHTRNILFKLIMDDISLFDYLQPLITDKIDFKKIDELKDLVDSQLLEENENLIQKTSQLEIRILKLGIELDNNKETIDNHQNILLEKDDKYLQLRDEKVRLECKKEDLENTIKIKTQKIIELEESINFNVMDDNEELVETNSNLIEHNSTLESKILGLEFNLDERDTSIKKLEEESKKLEGELSDTKDKFEKYQKVSKKIINSMKKNK